MTSFDADLHSKLSKRKAHGLYRELKTANTLIDFYSNDYLGLACSQELANIIHARAQSIPNYKNGSTGSRLLSGNSALIEQLEKKLAQLFRSESALLFNSGYNANLGVFSALAGKDDTVMYDELSHASIKDGIRLSLGNKFSFRHNDLNDLEKKIKLAKGRVFIAVESIYSMDGDNSPLKELIELKAKYDAVLIVDEAHSTGLYTNEGAGLCVSMGIQHCIDVRVYTFGKALGCHGACVACSDTIKKYLINFSRPFIYSTALSPHSVISIDCAFDFLKGQPTLQKDLTSKVQIFQSNIAPSAYSNKSNSSIQTIIIPGNDNVRKFSQALSTEGFDVRPILSPTVPKDKERLRICLHAFNHDVDIVALSKLINKNFEQFAGVSVAS